MNVTERVTPQGRIDLSLFGSRYTIEGSNIQNLRDAIQSAIDGGRVVFRLDRDARLPKPVTKSCFKFATRRGTERISKSEQKELLRLCTEADAGRVVYWPRYAIAMTGVTQ